MSHDERGAAGLEPAAMVLIPGPRLASSLAVVVRGAGGIGGSFARHGGFDTVAVIAPDEQPVRAGEFGPDGLREAGPDALLAAAAVTGALVEGRLGVAEPHGRGAYRLVLGALPAPTALTPGIVGAALALDPEFIADTGRMPALLHGPGPILVVPVEDRQCVEEARPVVDIVSRLMPGVSPELIVLFVSGPEGTPLPDPLPVTVFRGGTWPRPVPASAMAAAALAGLDDLLPPGATREILFTPARAPEATSDVATMRVTRDARGLRTIVSGAVRL